MNGIPIAFCRELAFIPLNHVDTKAIAQGAKDYTITTQFTFLDWVIAIFTSIVTVYPMTVQVQK